MSPSLSQGCQPPTLWVWGPVEGPLWGRGWPGLASWSHGVEPVAGVLRLPCRATGPIGPAPGSAEGESFKAVAIVPIRREKALTQAQCRRRPLGGGPAAPVPTPRPAGRGESERGPDPRPLCQAGQRSPCASPEQRRNPSSGHAGPRGALREEARTRHGPARLLLRQCCLLSYFHSK